jgi:hypothetical protein
VEKNIPIMIFYLFPVETPLHSPKRHFAAAHLARSGSPVEFPIKKLVEERRMFEAELQRLASLGCPVKTPHKQPQPLDTPASGRDLRREWETAQEQIRKAGEEEAQIFAEITSLYEVKIETYKATAEELKRLTEDTLTALTPK